MGDPARATLAALVRSEAVMLRTMRAGVRLRVDATAGQLARVRPGDTAGAIRIVQAALPGLTAAVSSAVADGRREAKRVALERLDAELRKVTGPLGVVLGDSPEDLAEAELAGSAYAVAWGAAAVAMVWRWQDTSAPSAAAIPGDAADRNDHRLRRIAATENAKAFQDAREEGTDWVAEQHGEATWFPGMFKQWDATLDRGTCGVCRDLDGQIRPFGFDFEGGQEPGYVHPMCRCVEAVVFVPLRAGGEGQAPEED